MSLGTTNKNAKLEILKPFVFFFAPACDTILIKTHSIESRCVIGPGNTPFAGAYVHLPDRNFYRLGQ